MGGLSDFGVHDFGDALDEARCCRSDCALFDFSFMSRARICGPGSRECLERVQSRPVAGMRPGEIRYGLCVGRTRAVVSDVTVWCMDADTYDVYSGRPDDIRRALSLTTAPTEATDLSGDTSVFAVQGPATLRSLDGLGNTACLEELPYFRHVQVSLAGVDCHVGRLGYTGERGFEIVVTGRSESRAVYSALAARIRPAGLIAADILRIEAGYLLFSNDCRLGCSSHELGLGRFDGKPAGPPRYRRVHFHSSQGVLDAPYAAPRTIDAPVSGRISVTSASPSIAFGGTVGMGLALAGDFPAPGFRADGIGIGSVATVQDRPVFDPDKRIARGHW